jgi:hypothetical protein
MAEGLGLRRILGRSLDRSRPSRRVRPGRSGGDDNWDPAVSDGRERGGYRFGRVAELAVGSFSGWTKMVPRGPLTFFFYFLFPFSFLFSLLFC